MRSPAVIEPAGPSDVLAMTYVHLKAFPDFFLSSLGPRTLNVFYSQVVQTPDGIAFVARDRATKDCVGLVAGTLNLVGFRAQQKHEWLVRYAVSAAPALALSPRKAMSLLGALRSADPQGSTPDASLMSLAVLPAWSRSGIGRQLVHAFNDEMRTRGRDTYALTTDADNNDAVNNFYLSLGFQPATQWARPDGRRMNAYEIDLSSMPPNSVR